MLVHAWGGILQTLDQTWYTPECIASHVTAIFKMKLTTAKVNWSNCPVALTVKGGGSKGGVTPHRHDNSIEDWLQCQQSVDTRANLGFICSNNARSFRLLKIGFEEKFNDLIGVIDFN
ncbi:hypothetical protein CDAR_191971 [Caerostris darwini]|uniref:Uncharacterized protein n=1 Tax=Caerostris darwini TaxID=1538125 RepID=A0AAV4NQH4_9ARAC|nr:hypothetical protein CDAR_191971 [Caerostris darwini]